MNYYEPRLPCDATQIGRFRRLLGEDGLEQLLKATIECAVDITCSMANTYAVTAERAQKSPRRPRRVMARSNHRML